MNEETELKKRHHHWQARLAVAIIMVALSFIGLIVSDLWRDGAWLYWRIMVAIFAVLSLFLSWYLRHKKQVLSPATIWHELVQWFGLILAVYLVAIFVNTGLIGRFEAGLVALTLLALNTFITGVYVEITFLIIGLLLGLFAAGAALLAEYLYTVMLPITVAVAVLLVWIVRKKQKH